MNTPLPPAVRRATRPATCRFVTTMRSAPSAPMTQPVPPQAMRKLVNSTRPTEGMNFSVERMRASVPAGNSTRLSISSVPKTT